MKSARSALGNLSQMVFESSRWRRNGECRQFCELNEVTFQISHHCNEIHKENHSVFTTKKVRLSTCVNLKQIGLEIEARKSELTNGLTYKKIRDELQRNGGPGRNESEPLQMM